MTRRVDRGCWPASSTFTQCFFHPTEVILEEVLSLRQSVVQRQLSRMSGGLYEAAERGFSRLRHEGSQGPEFLNRKRFAVVSGFWGFCHRRHFQV
jgi:hypothetical protein